MFGAICRKLGMSAIFGNDGRRVPVTLLRVYESTVIDMKCVAHHGYSAVVLGAGDVKPNRRVKPMEGKFKKSGIPYKAYIKEYRLENDPVCKVGDVCGAEEFYAGQLLDISGCTIGKGFAGVMKRHNFKGLEASHGVSISHRSHGSTGQRQDPGRVFKGKKMAGHMGDRNVTKQNLKVMNIVRDQYPYPVLVVKGAVPGSRGGLLYVKNAVKIA